MYLCLCFNSRGWIGKTAEQIRLNSENLIKKLIQALLLSLIVLCFCWAFPVLAADSPDASASQTSGSEPPTTTPSSFSASDISAEKVSQFVRAYLQVLRLIDRREPELQAAETESESLRIQQEIEAEAYEAIAAAGLTEPEYLQLLGLANTDAEFGERIAAQLQEMD
ncbi:MAG: DUF4168 domain-containing protein [Microcoleus sp. SIO2G3]|nr:DUF4168 domain-containing protein [Microcoleus sp. SIO2G3]